MRASCFVYAGRRGAGPHGITPADRLATSAVGVSRAKAAQAGFPHRGQPRPASLGAALGVGHPWSDLVTIHVVCTVSKVLCLRSLRTSRCCWAYTSFQTDSRLFRLTQTRISRCLAKVAAARAAPLVLSRPPQLRRVPAPAWSHSSTSPHCFLGCTHTLCSSGVSDRILEQQPSRK